eukprot:COSAG01_NODE_4084_length_5372_cov_6.319932_6_plen_42_part_01
MSNMTPTLICGAQSTNEMVAAGGRWLRGSPRALAPSQGTSTE